MIPSKLGRRIAPGTLTVSALTSTYEVRKMPLQSDQLTVSGAVDRRWLDPVREANIPTPVEVTILLDQSAKQTSPLGWVWKFSYFTNGMYAYWLTHFWSSGAAWSCPATFMDFDEADQPFYTHGILYRPKPGKDMTASLGGWKDISMTIAAGTIAT